MQQATNIARQMITKYGFSERLGPVVYGTSQEETFLGRDLGQGKERANAYGFYRVADECRTVAQEISQLIKQLKDDR